MLHQVNINNYAGFLSLLIVYSTRDSLSVDQPLALSVNNQQAIC
jgi:hypothetical protein